MIKTQEYKTPALKMICQEHTKEIIMFNLNGNCNLQPKMACVKCIQQYPAQYTPLEDVNIQWESYQKRNQSNLNELQNTRNSIQQKILKMIQEIKLQNDQIFNELIQSLINQEQSIEQLNQNEINKKSIYQLSSNQINEIISQLSQIDKFKTQKDHKMNIEKIDQIFYSDLRSRFEHLIQYQQINIQRFNQILINDNKVISEIHNLLQSTQDGQQESNQLNQIIEQIRQFMQKSFNFQFSQKYLFKLLINIQTSKKICRIYNRFQVIKQKILRIIMYFQ